ncbi:hypothetical protein LQ327_32150 [Actinomycetospora endophytica]|uniref:Golgi phosphoprotein 3 GPP34 n=1 Tax=Actinomycetospora endophytica TaxID=2291215 RepID=A0ABS8PIP4_9PSEU|nr:hypothetical protein [Actinomycetospora endophytica]MCD2198034.1 hypothetical protein [Actinomycetospora endophytica]
MDGTTRPLFPGVSVAREVPVTMAVRAAGAALLHPGGMVAGVAAAALFGADLGPLDVTVDLDVAVTGVRARPGLRLRRRQLPTEEVTLVDGVRVTTPARTAYDLARWLPRGDAVVLLDVLCARTDLTLDNVRAVATAHRGDRDARLVAGVLDWADPRSSSARDSRLRVALRARGLPRPEVDQRLLDRDRREVARLSLAWPERRTAVSGQPSAAAAAEAVGWEVLEIHRVLDAVLDSLACRLLRSLERWHPPPWLHGPLIGKQPRPPGPDGECDGGLSRLVPA